MTNKDLFTGLMNLHFRLEVARRHEEAQLVREAAAVVLAQTKAQAISTHPATSNGDSVATFFNNVVKIQKGEM